MEPVESCSPAEADESLRAAMDGEAPPSDGARPPPTELRLVLLGRKGTGKSAAGDTILGGGGCFQSGRPTEESVRRRGEVLGRRVTVVDTPGWEWYYPLNSTPDWVRRETLRGLWLCPPGPHALLLVVRSCAAVTDEYIREAEEHLAPLGGGAWEHAMVLFTRGDELGLATMEQRIQGGGAGLRRLLQKVGNRYHVVNNRNRGDAGQVEELMRKLEAMVEGQGPGRAHLALEGGALSGLEADGKRRARERRKKQRQMEAQMQMGAIKAALTSDGPQGPELDAHHSFSTAPRRLPEVRLVILGERETGKSSAGNAILGLAPPGCFRAGAATEESARRQAEVALRLVTVVDTPGWEAGATTERVRREIAASAGLAPPGPHALLLALRLDTVARAAHVRAHVALLGEGAWRHAALLLTHADRLRPGVDVERHVRGGGGGRDLQWLLERCGGRYHVVAGAGGVVGGVAQLLEKVERMATANRCEAFSGLVEEVRELSRRRAERFQQRLKEASDKALRQEAELRKMREREMKSIRWFFDRRRKAKSPGKADVQKEEEEEEEEGEEEEEERRKGGRKSDQMEELEERIRWLTEEREKEIQDLSLEKERMRVELSRSREEAREASLALEEKEREAEELRERSEEQVMKILDLERSGNEGRRREEEWRRRQEEVEEVLRNEGEELKAEMERRKIQTEDALRRKEEDKNREVAEKEEKLKREMEVRLLERDKALEEMRQKAEEEKRKSLEAVREREEDTEKKLGEVKREHEKEMERKVKEKESQIKELKEHEKEMEEKLEENKTQIKELKEQEKEMEKKIEKKDSQIKELKQQEKEMEKKMEAKETQIKELKQHEKEMEKKMEEKETQIRELKQNEKEMEKKIEKTESQIKELKQHEKEMEEKMEENQTQIKELKQHEKEMERIKEEKDSQIKELKQKEKEMEKKMEEKETQIKELKHHEKEMERKMSEQRREAEKLLREKEDELKTRLGKEQRRISDLNQLLEEKKKNISHKRRPKL